MKLDWVEVGSNNIENRKGQFIQGESIGEWKAHLDEQHFKKVRVYQVNGDQIPEEHRGWCWLIATEHYMDTRSDESWGVLGSGGFDNPEDTKNHVQSWLDGPRKTKSVDHRFYSAVF